MCSAPSGCRSRSGSSPPPAPPRPARAGGAAGAGSPGGAPRASGGGRQGWQAYVVTLDRRDEALSGLREDGIEAQIGTYAVNTLAAYRDRGSFPGADSAFARALALPFATTMTEDEVDRVATALLRYV